MLLFPSTITTHQASSWYSRSATTYRNGFRRTRKMWRRFTARRAKAALVSISVDWTLKMTSIINKTYKISRIFGAQKICRVTVRWKKKAIGKIAKFPRSLQPIVVDKFHLSAAVRWSFFLLCPAISRWIHFSLLYGHFGWNEKKKISRAGKKYVSDFLGWMNISI